MPFDYTYDYLALMQNHYTPLNYTYTDLALGLRLESPLHTLADLLTRPAVLCKVCNTK